MDQYAVAGHPISHSRSPFIHRLFAQQTSEALNYDALDIAPEDFATAVSQFRAAGGLGLNITLPLKELAYRYADECSSRVQQAGAANTLHFRDDGQAYADNTDGLGLIQDLTVNLGVGISGQRVLIIGAGGAARGVLAPLLNSQPDCLVIANRTASRAQQLCTEFNHSRLTSAAFEDISQGHFDIVINATSASLQGQALPISERTFACGACCYDMLYQYEPTAFLQQASSLGVSNISDGRGMLVEQAAESFLIWRGVRPDTQPVITALSEVLASGMVDNTSA